MKRIEGAEKKSTIKLPGVVGVELKTRMAK